MSERPSKRQKHVHNIFIDDQAIDSDEESEDEDCPEEDVESDGFWEPVSSPQNYDSDSRPSHAEDNNEHWERFVTCAEERGRSKDVNDNNGVSSGSVEWGEIWEIGCKVGCEEQIAFKALAMAAHPDSHENMVRAVIARTGLPGRVFAATASVVHARKFAGSMAELNPRVIKLVPHEDVPSILYAKNPFRLDGKDWARVAGRGRGWSMYKGDIGMIATNETAPKLVLIPRIKTSSSNSRQRPLQTLFTLSTMMATFGKNSVHSIHGDGSFSFKGRRYTKEGFVYCDTNEVDLYRPTDDIPTQKEFHMFKQCDLMTADTLKRTTTRLEQLKISIGCRVIIVQGEFRGLLGMVSDVAENEVTVVIDSLNHVQEMLKSAVRATYRIGDEVQICNGNLRGSVGWIVDVQDQMVSVVDVDKDMEVVVPKTDVEFHNRPFITTLRKRKPIGDSLLRGQDPNKIYLGKRVVVVGGTSYKAYRGTIKTTNPDGYAWVELDARQQQVVKFALEGLALLNEEETSMMLFQKDRKKLYPLPIASTSSAVHSESEGTLRCSTPMPENPITVDDSDAWNPDAIAPQIERPIHWLEDVSLKRTRMKLFTDERPNDILEFKEVIGDNVKVRDGRHTRYIPLQNVRAVRPNDMGDLVTPLTGSMIGVAMKVRSIQENICIVRRPGKVMKKNETDPSFPIACLIQIFPYAK